jgi:dihydrofolate reductase
MRSAGWETATINSGDVATEVKKLKEQPGKDIYIVGGASFAASLLDTGLVDEYRIHINPAVVGGGKSFFHQLTKNHKLEMLKVSQLSSQVIILTYKQLSTGEGSIPQKRRANNNPASISD